MTILLEQGIHGKILLYPGTSYAEKFDSQYSNIIRSCNNKWQLRQYIQAAVFTIHWYALSTICQ